MSTTECCDDDKASPKRSPTGRNIESDGHTTQQVVLAGASSVDPGGLAVPRAVKVHPDGGLMIHLANAGQTGTFVIKAGDTLVLLNGAVAAYIPGGGS